MMDRPHVPTGVPVGGGILGSLSADQLQRVRAMNDRRFNGWKAADVVRLHQRTAKAEGDGGVAYRAGIRAHLASGLYRRIYPPLVVEATRQYLASARD